MSTIGKIHRLEKDGKEQLSGNISTLDMNLKFELIKVQNKTSDNAPDYEIITSNSTGDAAKVGGVWVKSVNKIGEEPYDFFSMTFDDPSFPHALNVAAFPKGEAYWDIVWRRRQAA